MSLKYFGTDGIRGLYGGDSLNDEIAFRAGAAAVRVAKAKLGAEKPVVVVGRDTRISGVALLRAFACGVISGGGVVRNLGIAPTPCVAFAARESNAVLAVSITASHNPAKDNGIKFFEGAGVKPSEMLEQALDDAIGEAKVEDKYRDCDPSMEDGEDLKARYSDALISFFPSRMLEGKTVALDCANGAMSEIAPRVFEALGATVDAIAVEPDGLNINKDVGSEHPESLKRLYTDNRYDLGFAFDGDGDRVILSDEKGNRVSGEALLAALAIDAKAKGELSDSVLVTTVQSNLGLDAALNERGIEVRRTDVGDKHIVRLMGAAGYSFGGEESGHVVVGKFAATGDGLCAALSLAALLSGSEKSISEWAGLYEAFPQSSKAVKIVEKRPLSECENISDCIQKLESQFGDSGRLLVRYSGTEAKIRLLVEARDQSRVDAAMDALMEAVEKDLELV